MAIQFESLESDIMGRLGRLTVGNKTVRTPALLPVINPHLQVITPAEMRAMGIEALITNAYIFNQSDRFSGQVKEKGLHDLLGFDGVIMTDSGSFQLSVYGDVAITNTETLSYQKAIGSDIWVPLDIPTSPSADRATAERELGITMDRLREARSVFGDDAPIAAPVQGGIFTDLRERAGREVAGMGFAFCPIGAVVPLMESYRYRDLLAVVMASKQALSPASCVHLFGAGHPAMFAFAVALGCDIFDSAAYALYAKEGRYLTAHGSYRLSELSDLPCACGVCRGHTAGEIRGSGEKERLLALHNLHATLAEISRIRQAITDGTLWELVDERCRSHPQLLAAYRQMLGRAAELLPHDRASKRRFFYRGDESCLRTEVLRYQQDLSRLRLEGDVLIVTDCRGVDGYGTVLRFKPPFGPYPAELNETFPIGQSELPPWDEAMVRQGCRGIRMLAESHPQSAITVRCTGRFIGCIREELPGITVVQDES